jgi:molecular chaperone IbpA
MDFWKVYNIDASNFDRFFVGSDKIAKTLKANADWLANNVSQTFPPFNLKKTEDNKYVIEMAVAGFAKQDIEITLENNKLVIKGNAQADSEPKDNYLHMGIAGRAFTRQFTLADNVVIHNAHLMNGMLKVWLENIIPEDKKPKKIEIADAPAPASDTKTFLKE